MNYRIYHDESKRSGYWHGMLLVPEEGRGRLLELLQTVRVNTNVSAPLGIKDIKNATGRKFRCAQSWIMMGIGVMRSKMGKEPYHVHYGMVHRGNHQIEALNDMLGVKFILFREKDNHSTMAYLDRYAQKVETTFRMGFKGGMNFIFSGAQSIHVKRFHFDGNEHHDGGVDRDRIVGRLYGLKDTVTVTTEEDIIDDRSSDHTREDSQSYDDCQLLQLTDLLVGSFRTFLGECTNNNHSELARPVRLPIEAFMRGYSGFKNSRWYGSFYMSQCEIKNQQWVFSELEFVENATAPKNLEFNY